MLLDALQFITSFLDQELQNAFGLQTSVVSLSRIHATTISKPLRLTLINLETEHSAHVAIRRVPSQTDKSIQKNMYVMLSVHPDTSYDEGLKFLDQAMRSFETHPLITGAIFPNMPKGLDRIVIEPLTQTLDRQSALWQSLGAAYEPSQVYKMRMVLVQTDITDERIPTIQPVRSGNS